MPSTPRARPPAPSTLSSAPAIWPELALYLHEPMVCGLLAAIEAADPDLARSLPPRTAPSGTERAALAGAAHQRLFHLLELATRAELLHPVETPADLAGLSPGVLVDLYGTSFGNPLMRVLHFLATMMPFLESPPEPPRPGRGRPSAASATGDPEQEQIQRLVTGVVSAASKDLRENDALDIVMTTDGDLSAVVTLERQVLGRAGELQIEGRPLRVVGKAVSILGANHQISLLRRSVLAAASPQASREMLAELADSGLELEMADPVVEGPGLEIVPFAVLI